MPKRAEIRAIERKDRKNSRWGISFPRPGETARRVYYSTKAERDRELAKAKRIAHTQGNDVFSMTAADMQLLRELRDILPPDVDPREAARFYMSEKGTSAKCNVKEGVRQYLHSLQLRKLSQDHQDHVKKALERLEAYLGSETELSAVPPDKLTRFFAGLDFALRTVANNQQYITSFFKWAVKCGYCYRSPMESFDKIKVPETEPGFMPVADVEEFFKACLETRPQAAPYFALSFFAGLRTSQILRLQKSDIKFDQQGILMPGVSHKTARRFYVEGFEDNLWSWLEPWRNSKPLRKLGKSTLIQWREAVYTAAGIEFPHNAGRHSFCTYHIALYNDSSKTASLLTHRGVSMLYSHYRGNATKADGERFFLIKP